MKINMATKYLQINRICRVIFINFIFFASTSLFCYSQDLYNIEQSEKYAGYLFSSQQNILAAEEYERLIYFDNNNNDFKFRLIKSYRLAGDLNSGISRIYSFYGNALGTMPQSLANEFVKMQILSDSLPVAERFINQSNTISNENKIVFQSCNMLLGGKYKEAGLYVQKAVSDNLTLPSQMILLTEKAGNMKFKSPLLAGTLSAIVPGSGKFYTKNLSDGLFSLLFVASNAWQAYRGFHEHGVKSVYGWTFASLSASFYVGNIFGGVKAAKRYNTLKKNEIDNQIFEFVRSDSF